MARQGLPKKYAKMGFKKGWAAYKKTKRTTRTTSRRKPRQVKRTMARRRYKRAARRVYGARGGIKPIMDGAIGGIAAEAGQKFLGGYGGALGTIAAGYFMKNATLKTIGGYQLGSMLGDQIPGIGGGGTVAGGAFE